MERQPTPAEPEEHGVPTETPELSQIEAARLLANDSRGDLVGAGFSDDQIRHWAETYVAEHGGTADPADFVAWIDANERP